MAKVMLVEDDNNLREIYEARLAAEGYEIVSAADGEAALALAIKEKPDLIISDIMMPKVSGFDMLDILRSTTETKDCKIIMMTALNQAEDKARAEKLGADMYLVKSQVTLEDVVRAAKSTLGDQTPLSVGGIPIEQPSPASPPNATSLTGGTPAPTAAPVPANPVQPAAPDPTPVAPPSQPQPSTPSTEQASSTEQEEAALQAQIEQFISTDKPTEVTPPSAPQANPQPMPAPPAPTAAPVPVNPAQPAAPDPTPVAPPSQPQPSTPSNPPAIQLSTAPLAVATQPSSSSEDSAAVTSLDEDKPAGEQIIVKSAPASSGEPGIDASISGRKKVIQPISDVKAGGPDLNALAAKEASGSNSPVINSVVTPEGVTMQSPQPTSAPSMNDVIAPNPSAVVQPTTPVPPPVA